MSSALRIVNGKIYDPANNIDGEVRDICIQDGKIVESVPGDTPKIDAHGMVVMPGGVDIHSHIAGPKTNLARKFQPEDHRYDPHPGTEFTRSGAGGVVPSTFATGYRFATLGYTTVMEAAVPPLSARHVLEELEDTAILDKGYYVLMGNNSFLHRMLEKGRMEEFRNAVAWWLNASKAYTIKLVCPGGDEQWKGDKNATITHIDEKIHSFDITPRQVIKALIDTANDLGLPHPAHIHCNNLGHSGNYTTTLDTMRAAEGRKAHITHIQFNSYGGEPGKNPTSKAKEISDFINENPNISADVGQVMFGKSVSMTADAPLAWMLRHVKERKWINCDTECESGCGIIPFEYQQNVYTHTLQWAIGLELFLMAKDPWRMVLSTDHPNGGSFLNYPRLIRLLMDRDFRKQEAAAVNQKALLSTSLLDLDREYSLQEIAIVTRAAPARLLGLKHKGHLGVGADADITIYDEHENREEMFKTARYVLKDGHLFIKNHEFCADPVGRIYQVAPDYDKKIEDEIRPFFDEYYSVQFDNYPVFDTHVETEIVPTYPVQ